MRMHVVVEFDYVTADSESERMRVYGTSDSLECAQIDSENSVIDLLELAEYEPRVTITPETAR